MYKGIKEVHALFQKHYTMNCVTSKAHKNEIILRGGAG